MRTLQCIHKQKQFWVQVDKGGVIESLATLTAHLDCGKIWTERH